MKNSNHKLILSITGLLCAFSSASINAALISQTQSFSTPTQLIASAGGNAQPLLFDSFDPALGELTSVDLSIFGQFNINSTFPTLFTTSNAGVVGTPYPFLLDFKLDVIELNFVTTPRLIYSGTSPGYPPALLIGNALNTIDYSASLTGLSDLSGIAAIQDNSTLLPLTPIGAGIGYFSPGFLSGERREDFISLVPGSTTPILLTPSLSYLASPGNIVGNVNFQGNLTIDYFYEEVSAIPLPATLWLFGTALIGLLGFKKARG